MPDIFVSYSSDDRDRVESFVTRLRERGWDVWWDQQIAPGHKFDNTIERVIRDSSCVLVLWSKHSVHSEWVKNEAMVGLERECLVPVLLDQVDIPLAFRRVQAANLNRWPRVDETQIESLLDYVANVVAHGNTAGDPPPFMGHSYGHGGRKTTRRFNKWILFAALISVLVIAGLLSQREQLEEFLLPDADYRQVIAVLPFEVLSNVPQNEYFAAGIHDEILSKLARVDDLAVIARTSVVPLVESGHSIREIADDLNADMVMEGSVRFSGDRIRVSAQLIESESESHVWADVFEVELEDIFEVQSRIASMVSEVLTGEAAGAAELGSARSVIPEAYSNYLLAKHYVIRSQPEAALGHLDKAIELDPEFAAAYAEKSRYYYLAMTSYNMPATEAIPQYLGNLDKAYELDPDDPDVLGTLALAKLFAGDIEAGEELRNRLLEAAPNDTGTYMSLANWPVSTSERIELQRKAVELDPLNNSTRYRLVMFLLQARQYEEAVAQAKLGDSLEENTFNRARLAESLAYLGRRDESQDVYDQVIEMLETQLANASENRIEQTTTQSLLIVVLAGSGQRERAEEVLSEIEDLADQGKVSTANMVLIYTALQDVENTAVWMKRLIQELNYWFPKRYLIEHPYYDFIRDTPEYQQLLELTRHLP